MKGWIDRVFAVGRVYGGGRWFNGGVLAGKRAMCSVTVGAPEQVYTQQGVYGAIEAVLYPIHRGIFEFTGLTVIEPFVIYGPNRIDSAARAAASRIRRRTRTRPRQDGRQQARRLFRRPTQKINE